MEMTFLVLILVSYLIGSIPSGLILGKQIWKTDLREHGSKNIGATNAFRTLGKNAALLIFACDAIKGAFGTIERHTGHQRAAVHIVNGAAVHRLRGVGQMDLHAPVQQASVEQVKVGAVIFDVADQFAQHGLGVLLGVVPHILHVALVHPEDPEASVQILRSQRVFRLDLIARTADTLLADLADTAIGFENTLFFKSVENGVERSLVQVKNVI